jgi:YidC/Oxa1 family membrane protein insertase
MRNNVINFLFFLVIATGFYFLWSHAERNWFPQPKRKTDPAKRLKAEQEAQAARAATEARTREEQRLVRAAAGGTLVLAAEEARSQAESIARQAAAEKAREEKLLAVASAAGMLVAVVEPTKTPAADPPKLTTPPRVMPTLIPLGDDSFYIRALLSTEGGGVQQVVLTKFEEADRLGRRVAGQPLHLIPGTVQPRPYYLAENPPRPELRPGAVPPHIELAAPSFTVFHYPTPDDKFPDPYLGEAKWEVVSEERPEGGVHKVVFQAELGAPYFVKFRKTYTLAPKEYHIGLRLEIERLAVPGSEKGKGSFRYQISGPRGLPIEGEWYNMTYRVALVGWNDRKGVARRQYETAAAVATMRGGDAVPKAENTFKYMAVATQYFASAVAIDDTAEAATRNPWAYVRATTELPFDTMTQSNQSFFDDLTVRAASDTIDLAPGEKITHSYLLYNGPAKVRLLGMMEADRKVEQALVDRYLDRLGLRTITDHHTPTWLGSFANAIWWTDLVIVFTNVMHWLLAMIHRVVPWWALSIVLLTVFVRLLLHYPSKKQTQVNLKMMEVQKRLAPQIEELKKKYADDPHAFQRAKMQLLMANGVNPFAAMGGCLLLLAQMPVMMGLYFCLQESVFFRLERFLWIDNLAAPDMTLWWSEKIPYLSSPDNIGGMIYLGPYLNVLPLLAVGLMLWQQKKMMPPPTDEQTAAQHRMMKIMMIVMAVLFYKVAAGLAVYFIVSTLWGLVERRFVHRPENKEEAADGPPHGSKPKASPPHAADTTGPKPKGFMARLLERVEQIKQQADEQSKRQIRNPTADAKSNRQERKKKRKK